ncbi:MAG: hypothetical protein K1X56_14995 [Flavobacteriales bacterium]|nr:hypothetical protein [Flavobacteriales bacterium]
MARYTLTIPESKTEQVLAYLKSLRGVKVEEAVDQQEEQEDLFVPEWHKEIVLNRMKNTKPEEYVEWNKADKQLKKELGL